MSNCTVNCNNIIFGFYICKLNLWMLISFIEYNVDRIIFKWFDLRVLSWIVVDEVGLRLFGGWDLWSDLLEVLFIGFKFFGFSQL